VTIIVKLLPTAFEAGVYTSKEFLSTETVEAVELWLWQ